MANPVEFLVNGNPKDVDSGGFSDGYTIECQRAVVRVSLIGDGHCLARILLATCQPKPGYCPDFVAFEHGLLQYLRSREWC